MAKCLGLNLDIKSDKQIYQKVRQAARVVTADLISGKRTLSRHSEERQRAAIQRLKHEIPELTHANFLYLTVRLKNSTIAARAILMNICQERARYR